MVLFWHRRDLRTDDNNGLLFSIKLAKNSGQKVVPFFCIDPAFFSQKSQPLFRNKFLYESLVDLNKQYRRLGTKLWIIIGNPAIEIPQFCKQFNVTNLVYCSDFTDYAKRRDEKIRKTLKQQDIESHTVEDTLIFSPGQVQKDDGSNYTIFTPFKRKWLSQFEEVRDNLSELINLSDHKVHFEKSGPEINSEEILHDFFKNKVNDQKSFIPGGSTAGLARLEEFISTRISDYKINRERADLDGTSRLSPHLKFGTISTRKLFLRTQELKKSLSKNQLNELESIKTWESELIWREFYFHILANYPEIQKQSFKPQFLNLEWEFSAEKFEAWRNGQTGFPFIDASMRQLNSLGWMHNRGRMAVAMFLSKDLHINWQFGEKYFAEKLVDLDIASNNGGWQWSAGTGTDSAPYFRIFNPILQGLKCDPNGDFVRKWIPELSHLKGKIIHEPWKLEKFQWTNYPERIIDHNQERLKALSLYKSSSK